MSQILRDSHVGKWGLWDLCEDGSSLILTVRFMPIV